MEEDFIKQSGEIEPAAVGEMRKKLAAWLVRDKGDLEPLKKWLTGHNLPNPIGMDEDPYVWLLRGLPLADERYSAEVKLAQRAAIMLDMKLDTSPPSSEGNKLIYNLLMLCAGLSCPTELADPLYEMFERRELEGKHQSIDLRQSLESALITNQRDNRLKDVWLTMITRGKHHFLTGDEYAGFEGVRLMPASESRRGEPDIETIGPALAAMAVRYHRRSNRRIEFYKLIDRILRTYPLRPTIHHDLVYAAHWCRWPDWAVLTLPALLVPVTCKKGEAVALVWEVIIPVLESAGVNFNAEWLCGSGVIYRGQLARVHMPERAFLFLNAIARKVESHRLTLAINDAEDIVWTGHESLISVEKMLINGMVDGYGVFRPEHLVRARIKLREALGVMTLSA